jgi:peroxiredoxin
MSTPDLPAIGQPAPDFTLPTLGGGDLALSSFRGQKVWLAFFRYARRHGWHQGAHPDGAADR